MEKLHSGSASVGEKMMKISIVLVMMLLAASLCMSQAQSIIHASSGTSTTAWDTLKFEKNYRAHNVMIALDDTVITDLLYVNLNNDTTTAHAFQMHMGEALSLPDVTVSSINTRAAAGTIKRRILAY